MRVLLTGIEGYLGSVMAPVLAARGHQIVGLDAGFYREGRLYAPVGPFPAVIRKDIRRLEIDDLRGYEALIHLAELSNDPLGEHNPAVTFAINGEGSAHLARLAKQAGVRRFLYSSSCSVYGANGAEWRTEDDPTEALTAYAACKLRTEAVLGVLADDRFSPTCLRNATAYGASPAMRFDIVLNQFAGHAWTTQRIVMNSDGSPWRPLVHVLDIAEAFALVLDAPLDTVHNQILNVGCDGENYRVREIAAIVAAAFDDCAVTLGPSTADGRSYRVSFEKITRLLPGFCCRWTARDGAAQLREVFERIRLTPERFHFRAFTRLAQLTHLRASGALDEQLFWRVEPAAA